MHQPRSDPVRRLDRKNNTAFCVMIFLFLLFIGIVFYSVEYGLPAAQKSAGDNTSGKIILARLFFFLVFKQ